MAKVLIVDDEHAVRESLSLTLRYARHECVEVGSGKEALAALEHEADIDLVFCDVKMPEMDGLECLERMQEMRPGLQVVMISGHGTIETALEATKKGAYEFIEKPLDSDRLLLTIRNALASHELATDVRTLRVELAEKWTIIGESAGIKHIRDTIDRIAPTEARVLITGENGTGKELVARNLHHFSKRASKPFIDVNCAAIPTELIESELFGHEKGAFTGAHARKIGRIEQANGGTLFLDEIGDMDLSAQAKVLRALETNTVQRVGGDATLDVDVRVLAATNRNLEDDVAEGRFREDLLYRLNVIPVHVPPLRERPDDITPLLDRFVQTFREQHGLSKKCFSRAAIERLQQLRWSGNVRELRNLTERCLLMTTEDVMEPEHIEPLFGGTTNVYSDNIFTCASFEEFKQKSERLFLEKKLNENDWNIKRTAESLGMQRSNLYKKIDRYNLK